MLQGQKDLNTVTRRILSELAQVVNAQQGMFYILKQDEDLRNKKLKLVSAYAYGADVAMNKEFALIVLNTIETNSRTEELLAQSQSLTEKLRRTSEERQDKAPLLVKQKDEVEAKNKAVEEARRLLEEKAGQLQLTSKYKSEFLANMSHELRTPLNSLLILAQQLYENHDGNLSEKQVRYARTIHSCGDDLIQLINDILDLSKIESGYISTDFGKVRFREIISFVKTTFKHISDARNLRFSINLDERVPENLETDAQRLNQILKNLLSNAFKFTEKGEVRLTIYEAGRNWKAGNHTLDKADRVVAFAIKDTGIGISKDKQNIIFEVFLQAEGSTSRKYGGTGLGLSISRGLTEPLGGTIELHSEPGRGSTFTLFLPLHYNPAHTKPEARSITLSEYQLAQGDDNTPLQSVPTVKLPERDLDHISENGDDRSSIAPGDRLVLIVEDDVRFARIMIEKAHEKDLMAVVAPSFGEVLNLVNSYKPVAVTLDVKLPDASGWRILDLFKNGLNFRHIPVHLISGEENRMLAMQPGACSFLQKPLKNKALDIRASAYLSAKRSSTSTTV
ncbi:hypothetical protein GCM10023187_25290 [Nibrella viscosa]|uniref:histidine kinase n=1 Tax=Nibrella viscosa TaxID=1084524 RepID=A0ABP8KGE9_9BACT